MSRGARSALLALVAATAAAVAFAALRPDAGADPAPGPIAVAPAAGTAAAPTAPAPVLLVRVRAGEPVGGVAALSARSGDRVRFAVLSDAADELHLHGVDLTRELAPGRRALVSFRADAEGVFEVELHGSGRQVAELTIAP